MKGQGENPRILLVESDREIRQQMESDIASGCFPQYDIRLAADLEDAEELMLLNMFDLLVMDGLFPSLNPLITFVQKIMENVFKTIEGLPF